MIILLFPALVLELISVHLKNKVYVKKILLKVLKVVANLTNKFTIYTLSTTFFSYILLAYSFAITKGSKES